jgi:hypothetical protein
MSGQRQIADHPINGTERHLECLKRGYFVQSVLQEPFICAKRNKVPRSCAKVSRHLWRYLELIFN